MPAIKLGDVVKLRSGGLAMTVIAVNPDGGGTGQAKCCWFEYSSSGNQILRVEQFPSLALDLVGPVADRSSPAEHGAMGEILARSMEKQADIARKKPDELPRDPRSAVDRVSLNPPASGRAKVAAKPSVFGRTPLWNMALAGDLEGLCQELAAGADPNIGDNSGYTPLHVAAQQGRLEVAELLIRNGAEPNRTDHHGNSPLWTAVNRARRPERTRPDFDVVSLLLKSGADPRHRNHEGRTPRDLAADADETLRLFFELFCERSLTAAG